MPTKTPSKRTARLTTTGTKRRAAIEKRPRAVTLITGGTGFLGSHLVDRLLAEGHRVIAIDNLITGKTANIGHLAGNENFRFVKYNVSNFIFLPEE